MKPQNETPDMTLKEDFRRLRALEDDMDNEEVERKDALRGEGLMGVSLANT